MAQLRLPFYFRLLKGWFELLVFSRRKAALLHFAPNSSSFRVRPHNKYHLNSPNFPIYNQHKGNKCTKKPSCVPHENRHLMIQYLHTKGRMAQIFTADRTITSIILLLKRLKLILKEDIPLCSLSSMQMEKCCLAEI